LENSLRSGIVPEVTSSTSWPVQTPLNEAEQTNPPGITSTSTLKAAERRSSGSMVDGSTGRSLMTVSAIPALDTPGPDDHAGLVQGQVGRIEEECLPRLRLDRVESDALDRRAVAVRGHRQLQLDAVRPLMSLNTAIQLIARRGVSPCAGCLAFATRLRARGRRGLRWRHAWRLVWVSRFGVAASGDHGFLLS
jgi:hypothetical protein